MYIADSSLAVCKDALAVHRFQLAIVLAISEVFAVYGTEFIFSNQGALVAVGVGWLLLAMVDVRGTTKSRADDSLSGSCISHLRKARHSTAF